MSLCLHFGAVFLNYPEGGDETSVTANRHGVISQTRNNAKKLNLLKLSTLHVDHTGYTALRHFSVLGYVNIGVTNPPWYKTVLEARYSR